MMHINMRSVSSVARMISTVVHASETLRPQFNPYRSQAPIWLNFSQSEKGHELVGYMNMYMAIFLYILPCQGINQLKPHLN